MVFAGRKVKVKRPRVRSSSGEVPLKTYQRFQEDGSLQRAVAKRLVLGVSSRHYEGVLEDFCQGYGIKKSSVSRRWVKATAFAITRDFTGQVRRWCGGDQVQRWAAAALLEGEKRWQRVKGYKSLPLLEVALQRLEKRAQVA